MRFLLSIILIVAATALACHGLFNEDVARDAYEALSHPGQPTAAAPGWPRSRAELIATWPYTSAASEARADILAAWEKGGAPSSGVGYFHGAWQAIRDTGFEGSLPFALPFGVVATALAALLLCVVLPRTRFRDFAVIFLLLGALAFWPALASPARQVQYVGWFDPLRYMVTWNPQIAVGLLFIAGLLLVGVRRPQALAA